MHEDMDWLEEEKEFVERLTRIARMVFWVLAAAVMAGVLTMMVSVGSFAADPLTPTVFGPAGPGA